MEAKKLAKELEVLSGLLEKAPSPDEFSVVVGFDGFIDEIIDVVDKRSSFDSYQRLTTIEEFGARISRAAGLSTNMELVTKQTKLGGNGPIMGNALCSSGTSMKYIGALGNPTIKPVFSELVERCEEVYSIAEPGRTDALEFNDGKVMLGKLLSLNDINWDNFVAQIGIDKLRDLFANNDLIATVNWTMMPHMTDIWRNLLEILPKQEGENKPVFFVDLADPEKRKDEDIREAIEVINEFTPYFRVILGLNRKEASEIADVRGVSLSNKAEEVELEEITKALYDELNVWCLMVHPTHSAAAVCQGEYAYTPGPYTSSPKLTTGAGDNFNAGFCVGVLLNLPLEKALMLGTATSGFYVRNMHSPSFSELKNFVKLWADNAGEDF